MKIRMIMEKIKSFFSNLWGYIAAVLGVVAAVALYLFTRKQEENSALKAKLALANTQKEVDIIEAEIKQASAERQLNQKEQEQVNKDLQAIEEKRKNIQASKSDQEIEDYWNKK